jgi:hypothetical protein
MASGLPDIVQADPSGSASLYGILGRDFTFAFSDLFANELDQLSKLLPDD